jgi:dolichol-phosphate mannosyltransferase
MSASKTHGAPALSMVIPTYNERTRIAEFVTAVFAEMHKAHVDGEVVVVDDNSPDGTGQIVDGMVPVHAPRLVVIHRPGKLGLGTAVMDGFIAASAPVVGVMDADFSHPPAALPRLLDALSRSGADVVIGSRYIPGGGAANWPRRRLLLSKLACLLARPLTPVRDATSGFFLIRRSVVEGVTIQAGGFKICLELLMRSPVTSVVEVPYIFVDRTIGKSKMTMREALGYLVQLKTLFGLRLREPRGAIAYRRLQPPR